MYYTSNCFETMKNTDDNFTYRGQFCETFCRAKRLSTFQLKSFQCQAVRESTEWVLSLPISPGECSLYLLRRINTQALFEFLNIKR